MNDTHIFHLARVDTPTGPMLVVTDKNGRLRALEWESHRDRLLHLLDGQYGGAGRVRLVETADIGVVGEKLKAYFAGDGRALEDIEVETVGTEFRVRSV